MATFTGSNGQRIKGVSHKNLWYHTKDAPIIVRWGKTGNGQYGPFAGFEVQGDSSGEYLYKPQGKGETLPPERWAEMEALIGATGGDWVAVTAAFGVDGLPILSMEDQNGNPVLPGDRQVKEDWVGAAVKELDLEPVNQPARDLVNRPTQAQATGTPPWESRVPLQADQDLMLRCAVIAGGIVDAFQEHLGRPMTEDDRAIAISLFIQNHR